LKLLKLEKVHQGKYLKSYELTYENKSGREKKYEIVSRRELNDITEIGKYTSGVSIVATMGDKMLLLREFRMGVGRFIYNLCAGMIEQDESLEECISRELYEETGLHVKEIKDILPPSFSAVAISDVKTYIAFIEAEGDLADHSSENELIEAAFYTREEVKELLQTQEFSSRAMIAAYYFARS